MLLGGYEDIVWFWHDTLSFNLGSEELSQILCPTNFVLRGAKI